MAGHIIREGHECPKPQAGAHSIGTVWQCDCGRYWLRSTGLGWVSVSSIEVALLRLNDRMAAAQKVAADRAAAERALKES